MMLPLKNFFTQPFVADEHFTADRNHYDFYECDPLKDFLIEEDTCCHKHENTPHCFGSCEQKKDEECPHHSDDTSSTEFLDRYKHCLRYCGNHRHRHRHMRTR